MGFYLIAAVDLLVPESIPIKRVTSLARTFVVLVVSGLAAVRIFFVSPQQLWKETQVRKVSG